MHIIKRRNSLAIKDKALVKFFRYKILTFFVVIVFKNNNLSAENKLLQELDEIDRNYSLVVGDKSADLCFHD